MKFLFGSVFGIFLILAYGVFLLVAAVAGFDAMWDASWLIKLPVGLIVFSVFPWLLPFFSIFGLHDAWGHNWLVSVLLVVPWFIVCAIFAIRKGLAALFGIAYLLKKQ